MELSVDADVASEYEELADRLEGFDSAEALMAEVLSAVAVELRRREEGDAAAAADASVDAEDMEERLENLGYL